jgi:hypothetical protein
VKSAWASAINRNLNWSLLGVHTALAKGAKVINASWRTKSKDTDFFVKFLQPTLQRIQDNDALLICAAGNDSLDIDGEVKSWPAAIADKAIGKGYSDYVISVGAWSIDSTKITYFSNYGTKSVDIFALGSNISVKLNDGTGVLCQRSRR